MKHAEDSEEKVSKSKSPLREALDNFVDGKAHQEEILEAIRLERLQQDHKWGEQNYDDSKWLAILVEEVGEAAKAILDDSNLEEELVQTASVIVCWLQCRKRAKANALQSSLYPEGEDPF